MSVKIRYNFCLLKLDLILTCLDFGLFDLNNLVWGQVLTEREKPTDSSRQHIVTQLLQSSKPVCSHQQFLSHWIFPALLLFCTAKLTCQLWGCQPWAGLPPCLAPAVASPSLSHSRHRKTLPSGIHTLQGNKISITALMSVFYSSVEQVQPGNNGAVSWEVVMLAPPLLHYLD